MRPWAAFISLHLFLYPAATAFNAAFDRDEGPVAGMARPPPVPPGLGPVTLYRRAGAILDAATAGFLLFLAVEARLR